MTCQKTYPITVEEFKDYFDRDFPYSSNPDDLEGIRDKDILKAFGEASLVFNPAFFACDKDKKLGFLYLAAHYLVVDINNSSQGLSSNFAGFLTNKSVGSVSVGKTLPDWIMASPIYSEIALDGYGNKYLSLIITQMVGNVVVVKGTTLP